MLTVVITYAVITAVILKCVENVIDIVLEKMDKIH